MLSGLRSFLNAGLGQVQTFVKEKPDYNSRAFIRHNRKTWAGYRSKQADGEILVEVHNITSGIVAQSYVGSYLGRKENAKLIGFTKGTSRANKKVYGSFIDSFLMYSDQSIQVEINSLLSDVLPKITSKRSLEELSVDGMQVGDLIYDLYLRKTEKPTVDISSPELADFVKETLGYLVFWRCYFKTHRVKAVLISHCVYPWAGVISRVAISNLVPVYLTMPNKIYYVTKSHNGHAYNEYLDYPKEFALLSTDDQARALLEARQRLSKRLRGERDIGRHRQINLTYSTASATRVLANNDKFKVLIASHCYSDDNHVFGDNLFPDIYEWLNCIGRISRQTDYDWYIKLHPDRYSWETEHVKAFVQRFPNFTLLDSDVPLNQIVKDGINCALTIYGSISFEFAAQGVPVVTSSRWTPTVMYDFNVHPDTVEAFEQTLLNLKTLDLQIDRNKVYEFYYNYLLNEPDNWLYHSFERLDEELSGGAGYTDSVSYKKFLDQFSETRHIEILKNIDTFVASKNYCLRKKHLLLREPVVTLNGQLLKMLN